MIGRGALVGSVVSMICIASAYRIGWMPGPGEAYAAGTVEPGFQQRRRPKPCNLDLPRTRVMLRRTLHENIGVYSYTNDFEAKKTLDATCEAMAQTQRAENPAWRCGCEDFTRHRANNWLISAELSAEFVCRVSPTAEDYRQAVCLKVYGCIAEAQADEDIAWLSEKSEALGCKNPLDAGRKIREATGALREKLPKFVAW